MHLTHFLDKAPKADLQGYYLYWLPDHQLVSERDRLAGDLFTTMSDQRRVRERFDGLGRSHQAFLTSLLSLDEYAGTVEQVLGSGSARKIEDFEVETVLKTLRDGGFVHKEARVLNGSGRVEVFTIPEEIGAALRRTVSIESRDATEMLSRERSLGHAVVDRSSRGEDLSRAIGKLEDARLRGAVEKALEVSAGILPHSLLDEVDAASSEAAQLLEGAEPAGSNGAGPRVTGPQKSGGAQNGTSPQNARVASGGGLYPAAWRAELEQRGLGTVGVLQLKDYGVALEEESLIIFQECAWEHFVARAIAFRDRHDVEVHLGTDFIIDLEHLLETFRTERLDVTREGRLYKKTEERLARSLTTTRYRDLFGGSTVSLVLETCRKLRFVEWIDGDLHRDPIRRRAWKKKSLLDKYRTLFDLFLKEPLEAHWSFHQETLRQLFLEHVRELEPGSWLGAQDLLHATLSRYLLLLDENGVRDEYLRRCDDDFQNERLSVSLERLQRDLTYWVVHRLVLLGILDVAYEDGLLRAFRISDLGLRFFGDKPWNESEHVELPALVNPDFEVLVFPGMALEDEANLALSRFADRQESDPVKRYRLTRESVKRGVVSGLTAGGIVADLERFSRSGVPENIRFSLHEWTEGVEFVRCRDVKLLTTSTREGMDRLVEMCTTHGIVFERFGDSAIAVRGARNERALRDLREPLRDLGLYLE